MTEHIQIQAGELHATETPRVHIGTLLKWGEEGQTNLGRLTFDQGTLTLPRSPEALAINYGHDPATPVARITHLEDTGTELRATFKVADTDEGDVLEAEIADGSRKAVSVDVSGVVIRAGRAVAGKLYGAAFVAQGAFPSSVLHAEIAPDTEAEPAPEDETPEERLARLETELADARAAINTATDALAPEVTEPEDPAEEKENAVADAVAPNTLAASAVVKETGLNSLFSLITESRAGNKEARAELERVSEGQSLHAALADVKFDGTNAFGTGVVQPAFVGELWSGRTYERKFIPLINNSPLTALENKGWRFVNKPVVAPWAGNKAEIASTTATTESYTYKAQRFAHGNDIAREFYDFNETGVIQRFLELVVDSYAEVSDNYVFNQVLTASTKVVATAATGTRSPGVTKILQGIRAVDDARGDASFAVVAPDVFEEILFSQDKDKLEFVSGSMGLNSGTLFGLNFVRHSGLAAGQVLVGDKNAATSQELAGTPIRVSGIDLLKGGIDEAIYAYIAARIDKPSALVLISNPA